MSHELLNSKVFSFHTSLHSLASERTHSLIPFEISRVLDSGTKVENAPPPLTPWPRKTWDFGISPLWTRERKLENVPPTIAPSHPHLFAQIWDFQISQLLDSGTKELCKMYHPTKSPPPPNQTPTIWEF